MAALVPTVAAAEPKPTAVDVKPFRDQLIVLQDAQGGTYAVLPGKDGRAFFGTGKALYEQLIYGRSTNDDAWDVSMWAPRVPNVQPGSIMRKADGSFSKWCGSEHETSLTQLTADKAKQVLDKSSFWTSAMIHRPHLLARDDAGVYYYVDVLREQYGGKGYRVFVGKKGAMKQLPLSDIASDTAGEVFATKSGNLRFIHDETLDEGKPKTAVTWVRGEKRSPLVQLDVDMNSPLIFKDLGIYAFLGTICDDL